MWFLAAAALAAPPEPSDSLASQLKRGLLLHSGDFGEVQLVRVVLYPEIIRLSDSKLELLLEQEEWLAIGMIETAKHGRLRVTCHLDECLAEGSGISIELSLVKGPLPEEASPKKGQPRKSKSEAVAERERAP
jgi:hypothetical protein